MYISDDNNGITVYMYISNENMSLCNMHIR